MGGSRPSRPDEDSSEGPPREITMTDLGWNDDMEERDPRRNGSSDHHAAGTPGGGTASGGLAGTNVGDGDPDNVDLDDALGSGIDDTAGEEEGEGPENAAYGGPSGGAVGGTPAGLRSREQVGRGFDPGNDTGMDTTIGSGGGGSRPPAKRTGRKKSTKRDRES